MDGQADPLAAGAGKGAVRAGRRDCAGGLLHPRHALPGRGGAPRVRAHARGHALGPYVGILLAARRHRAGRALQGSAHRHGPACGRRGDAVCGRRGVWHPARRVGQAAAPLHLRPVPDAERTARAALPPADGGVRGPRLPRRTAGRLCRRPGDRGRSTAGENWHPAGDRPQHLRHLARGGVSALAGRDRAARPAVGDGRNLPARRSH